MRKRTKVLVGIGVVAALGAGGTAALAGGDDDATDTPISGAALQRASQAALDHTGGGKVTETEVGDEESYYEVEVTKPDGSQVDVHLDKNYNVLGTPADHEGQDAANDGGG